MNTSGERDGAYTAKGTSSEEVEGLLVFDVGTNSSASSAGASKASSHSSRATAGSAQSRGASSAGGSKGKSRSKTESWASLDLDALMASDGRLDVDAVSAALGLAARLSRSSSLDASAEDDADDFSIEARSVRSAADELGARDAADDADDASGDSLVRPHGSQLYPIIEEDCVSECDAPASPYLSALALPAADTPARPSSYVVVGTAPAQGSTLHTLGAPALAALRLPPPGGTAAARLSAASISTADLRGSVNESVLELDLGALQFAAGALPEMDFSGAEGGGGGFGEGVVEGVSLFGLGDPFGGVGPSGSRESQKEEGSFSAGVGVAF